MDQPNSKIYWNMKRTIQSRTNIILIIEIWFWELHFLPYVLTWSLCLIFDIRKRMFWHCFEMKKPLRTKWYRKIFVMKTWRSSWIAAILLSIAQLMIKLQLVPFLLKGLDGRWWCQLRQGACFPLLTANFPICNRTFWGLNIFKKIAFCGLRCNWLFNFETISASDVNSQR